MNKNKTLQVILVVLIIYCIYSIFRSLGILYIAYTDDYFYNLDFKIQSYREKNHIFNNAYYYFTYIAGLFTTISMKKILNLNWIPFLITIFSGLILFRLIDSGFIRPAFGFFMNTRMNVFINLMTFLALFIILLTTYKSKFKR